MESDDQSPQTAKPISALMLSHLAGTALDRANIKTIDELCQMTANELRDQWQVGYGGLSQIRARLAEMGLKLKGD